MIKIDQKRLNDDDHLLTAVAHGKGTELISVEDYCLFAYLAAVSQTVKEMIRVGRG